MNARIVSARGIAGYLGKGPVIGVAIIVLLVAAVLGTHALRQPGSASHDAKVTSPSAFIPAVSTAPYADDLMRQQEDFIQTMAARTTMRQAAAQSDDVMSQQEDLIHTLAARADARSPMMSEQQRILEESTTAAATVPYYRTIDGATYYDRLTSQDTTSSIDNGSWKCTHPVIGFPTCYTLQADGTWTREELIVDERGADWAVVGTVTYDEMQEAIDEANASAP
jgi:hypothetical protein